MVSFDGCPINNIRLVTLLAIGLQLEK